MKDGEIEQGKMDSISEKIYINEEKELWFNDKNTEELNDYLNRLEEAKKRDHRKIGKELEIFAFDDEVGPGLPLWLPNGTVLIDVRNNLKNAKRFFTCNNNRVVNIISFLVYNFIIYIFSKTT